MEENILKLDEGNDIDDAFAFADKEFEDNNGRVMSSESKSIIYIISFI
jgi:hypothetical protein